MTEFTEEYLNSPKLCKKCGETKAVKDFRIRKNGWSGHVCKKCEYRDKRKWKLLNPIKNQEHYKKRYLKHKERFAKQAKIYVKKPHVKLKIRERTRKYKEQLADHYIRKLMSRKCTTSMIYSDIPKELIDLKRIHMQIKRFLIQEKKQCKQAI